MNVRGNKIKMMGSRQGIRVAVFLSAFLLGVSASAQTFVGAKVSTKGEGFFRVAASNLAEVFSVTESEIVSMALYVENMGLEVASIRDGGDVVFYAHRYEGLYTDENVFYVKEGQSSAIPTLAVGSGYTPYFPWFASIKRFEQHHLVRSDLVETIDEDPILWRTLTSGLITKSYDANIMIDNPAVDAAGFLTVRLKGATAVTGRYYHRARIDLNGQTLGYIDFEGLEAVEETFFVDPGYWLPGNNVVRVESTPPPGTFFDSFFLNNIEADYDRAFVAFNGQLTFPVLADSLEVTGFDSSNILLWDVTDQWGIREVTGQQVVQDGSSWKFTIDTTEFVDMAALSVGSERVPTRIVPAFDFVLKDTDWSVDHLVISCPLLQSSAAAITQHRQDQGLDAAIVSIDDVYDAFNYGIRDARALIRFLNYTYHNWSKHPRYVLLVGDGSIDYRNVLGNNDSQIPAVPLMGPGGLFASDYLYGDPSGTGDIKIAVGRIPVNTPAELDEYITKMLKYELGGDWRANQLVSTDQNDYGGDFLGIGNELSSIMEGNVHRGDLTTQSISEVRSAVIGGINEGREVSMYVGHGTPNQLSSQSILLINDMQNLTNDVSPTAFVAIGCLIGSFNDPGKENLGEGLVRAKGGAVTVAAAATLISAGDGKVMSEPMLDELYTYSADRIGDAWLEGKKQLTFTGRHPAFRAFQLMGDPATAVGVTNAARVGNGAPSLPQYHEWADLVTPPVLEDMGYYLLEENDDDGDGSNNFSEYKAGTDPLSAASYLEIVKIRRPGPGQVEVSWPSSVDRSYTIESAESVSGPYTEVVTGVSAAPPINNESFSENSFEPRFYRVRVE